MDQLELDITDISVLPWVAEKVLDVTKDIRVFTFDAEMGAGKTTLIKQLCAELGSTDNFSSPTYSIVNEYDSEQGKLYHFDLYRVKSEEELYDLGFEEYLSSGNYCFIEWPEKAESFLPENYASVKIFSGKNRILKVEKRNSE